MVILKFGAFVFTLCLLLQYCVCESNETTSCAIQDNTATCADLKTLQDTNITKLIIKSKDLKRINKDDLALLVNLEEIDLSDCDLEEIDGDAFVGLTKLHKVNLSGNKKLKIPTDASFITSDTITCLNLSNTDIEELGDMLHNLPQLHNLDLSGTNVKDFSPLGHLEHLTNLVVSKTNETLELCNILSIKEIIEKDENGTQSTLDCKAKKEDVKIEVQNKTETPEAKTEPTSTSISTISPKKEDEVVTEAPTVAPLNATTIVAEIAPKIVPEVAPKIASNIAQQLEKSNITKETNKTDVEPNLLHEYSEDNNKTDVVPKLIHGNSESEATTVTIATENIPTTEATIKNETEAKVPENEKEVKKSNIKLEEKIVETDAKGSNEKPQVLLDAADDVILPSTENKSQSNGVNIVLGIILCVMVVGAIGFGFKYWKNRRSGYTHANTHDHDDDDKELQTIVAHRTDADQN